MVVRLMPVTDSHVGLSCRLEACCLSYLTAVSSPLSFLTKALIDSRIYLLLQIRGKGCDCDSTKKSSTVSVSIKDLGR